MPILPQTNLMKKTRGLTLIELTIVMAIIAIIAAIIVPVFLLSTDRARLRGDIQSARIIQNAMDLYRAERGTTLPTNISDAITRLGEVGYINVRNVNTPQTQDAVWHLCNTNGVLVDIHNSPDEVHSAYQSLNDTERFYIYRGR